MGKTLLHVICDSIRHNTVRFTAVYESEGATIREHFNSNDELPEDAANCAKKGEYIGSSWTRNDDGTITQHDYYKA